MRLVEKATGRELKEGDSAELRGDNYIISCVLLRPLAVYLIDPEADKAPFTIRPAAIGAEFRQ